MTTAIKRRRGTTSQHSTFTGLEGEITIDTTKDTVVVHDGSTAGGFPLAKENNPTFTGTVTIPTADINGGAIDGAVIGGASAAAGTFTTGQFNTSLNVDGTVTADGLTVDGDSQFGNSGFITFNNSNPDITLKSVGGNSSYGNVILDANGRYGSIQFRTGYDGSAIDNEQRMKIDTNGDISFYEDTGTTAKLFWDASAESLGIGTSSPSNPLTINSADEDHILLENGSESANIQLRDSGNMEIIYKGSGNKLKFMHDSTERMRIDDSGNVGIGTSSPASRTSIVASGVNGLHLGQQTDNNANSARLFYDNSTNIWTTYSTAGSFKIASGATIGATSGTDRLVIDSSGNVLVGKTTTAFGTAGSRFMPNGQIQATASGQEPYFANRLSSDGVLFDFRKDGTTVGSIGVDNLDNLYIQGTSIAAGLQFGDGGGGGNVLPHKNGADVDNTIDLGSSSRRFDDIYATNTTIIGTSDANEKQQIASLTDAEVTAAKALSKLFKTFKWNSAVESKGDNARTHTGHIAQDIQQAMTDAGLDAGDYAFFISTTWWETQTEVPAVEADEENGIEAVDAYTRTDTYETAEEAPEGATERTRLGVRYAELLAFIGAATEQRLTNIEARLTALEN